MKIILNEKVPIKIWTSDIEEEAKKQLINMASLPFVFKHIAVMPDVHVGIGATIGSVFATKKAICPAAVGVDIGCGMRAIQIGVNYKIVQDNIQEIRKKIEELVPVGFEQHTTQHNIEGHFLPDKWKQFNIDKAYKQIGTLGGGNHFIEICLDTNNQVWIVIHTGSRNLGKTIADYHINKAKTFMKDMFISLPDPDLAYFAQSQPEFKQYIEDVKDCQSYAKLNREMIVHEILNVLGEYHITGRYHPSFQLFAIDCHHNYLSHEHHFGENVWVTRKGAVRAREGEFGIIPGSMGTKSYIVKGVGNPQSFCSCSHGAGRRMSRKKARDIYTQEDLINQTQGVECRKDIDVIDEIPGAYKDIDVVMENQKDLVEIVHELKQIMCIKG